jgi:hypothetical protein
MHRLAGAECRASAVRCRHNPSDTYTQRITSTLGILAVAGIYKGTFVVQSAVSLPSALILLASAILGLAAFFGRRLQTRRHA